MKKIYEWSIFDVDGMVTGGHVIAKSKKQAKKKIGAFLPWSSCNAYRLWVGEEEEINEGITVDNFKYGR